MGRAWDKIKPTGSPSSTAPPSPQTSSSALPQVTPSSPTPISNPAVMPSQLPLPPSPQPALVVSAPPGRATPAPAPPPPAAVLSAPSLQIPSILQGPALTSSGSVLWSSLSSGLRNLHTRSALFPVLHSATGSLLLGVESFEESAKSRKEYEPLVLELKTLGETLDLHLQGSKAPPMLDFIVQTLQKIQKQLDIIAQAENQRALRRAFEAETVRDALVTCDRCIESLSRQIQNAQIGREIAQIDALNPAKLAMYDSTLATEVNRRACTENTRVSVLLELESWLANRSAPNICWMNGMAGTGKTTIAYTFAKSLEQRKQLAASFFCTRTTEDCRDVNRIVPTIAYQLARHFAQFRSALYRILNENPDLPSRTLSTQFDRLLRDPLIEVQDAMIGAPVRVVVIDALDECNATNGVELVLDTLLRASSHLPLRFFVASRPEPSIRSRIQDQPETLRLVFELHDVKRSEVRADIELYLRAELPFITQSQVEQLAMLSGTLFIYAATAARYIRIGEVTGDLDECLETMLSVTPSDEAHTEIDQLYMTILSAADGMFMKKDIKDRMRLVLWTAVCAREPVSVETLAVLAGIHNSKKALAMLQPLRSVLHVADDGSTVSTLHASFPDFLFKQSRSAGFFCNAGHHNQLIAEQCFVLMKSQLRFNICGLETSHLPDEAVSDLIERISNSISPTLAYTCRYWADHLREAPASDMLSALSYNFLSDQLLFWMEVMNLKHWMGIGVRVIIAAKVWLMANYPSHLRLAEDARNFVTSFAANPVSRSTPHIYVSALALCHRSSAVYKNYWKRTCGLIEPRGAGIDTREVTVLASWTFEYCVNSVAYSPDHTSLVLSYDDGNVTVQDAYDGTLIGAPLTGHTARVTSAAFSLDGRRIVSGSDDHTVRVWSNLCESPISSAFLGHTDAVTSVAFSPDGTRIVSGSNDFTIRLWNAHDGTLAHPAFESHTDVVASVAFSPDGRYVASGSHDWTACIWDMQAGTIVGSPFEGHTNNITSVAFSPDGRHFASGSDDYTIQVWATHDRLVVGSPLKGHVGEVTSVAFSPDGTHIVSGSADGSVRLWSVHTSTLVGTPFEGHIYRVISVAFSPDGTRVASASDNYNVRVWNIPETTLSDTGSQDSPGSFTSLALSPDGTRLVCGTGNGFIRILNTRNGAFIGNPLIGHTRSVNAVAFSSDSTHLVSGSYDCTICIWDVNNWVRIGAPLEGHAPVRSLAFSPDGTRIVSGSDNSTIHIWGVGDRTVIRGPLQGHNDTVLSVAFSPTGTQVASGSADHNIILWDAEDGTLVGTRFEGHTNSVRSVAFSPDGTLMASGSEDRTVRIWNVQDGATVKFLEGHPHQVVLVAFSPDGTRVISGSMDRAVRVWDVQEGTLISAPLPGFPYGGLSLAFLPDGAYIYSMFDTTISAWNLAPGPSETDTWTIAEDGWVVGPNSQLHFWLPADLVPIFPTQHNRWTTGSNGPIRFDYNSLPPGDAWKECYLTPQ